LLGRQSMEDGELDPVRKVLPTLLSNFSLSTTVASRSLPEVPVVVCLVLYLYTP
jgi:hypothetical protein